MSEENIFHTSEPAVQDMLESDIIKPEPVIPFENDICLEENTSEKKMKKEESESEEDEPDIWIECEIDPKQHKALEKLVADHKGMKSCKLCKKYEPSRVHFVNHLQIKRFECIKCGKRFCNKSESHSVTHLSKRDFACAKCPKKFRGKDGLRKHLQFKHPDKPFERKSCEVCGKSLKSISLKAHMFKFHSKQMPICICSICGHGCVGKTNLRNHMATHSEDRPFECDQCSKRFKLQKTLKKHLVIHSTELTHFCPECGGGFKRQESMRQHVLRKHSNPNPFICDICGFETITRALLKCHAEIHDKTTYKCQQCDKVFNTKANLTTHEKNIHSQIELACPHCDKTFPSKQYLGAHIRAHKREDVRYFCICGKSYKGKIALRDHAIIHRHQIA